NQATIQDGRVTVQNVQRRQTQSYAGNVGKVNATGPGFIQNMGNANFNQPKEKMLVVQDQEAGVALYEEQLSFLADTGERVNSGIDARTLTTATIFQTNDINAFDSTVMKHLQQV
nr:hypothetical protein [Tanacetum cinerariifolium]